MKKHQLIWALVLIIITTIPIFSQTTGKIYLSLQANGRVYDITTPPASATTAVNLPAPLSTPNVSANPNRMSNLAIGYNATGGKPSQLAFFHSHTENNSQLYRNDTVVANALLPAALGGLATNNVPGPFFGMTYGFQRDVKSLYRVNPTPQMLGPVTGDADWTNGTTFGTDAFFDYENHIYTFITRGTNRFLYKIKITNGTSFIATKVFTLTGQGTPANLDSVQGMAYLNGVVYLATVVQNPSVIQLRKFNMSDGITTLVATYNSPGFANLDMAAVEYFEPFKFTCGTIGLLGNGNFVLGTSSNRTLRIPISNVYAPGTYTVNVTGTDFTPVSHSATITPSTTFIDIPINFTGTGVKGNRTLTVDLNGSTTTCSYTAFVDADTDGDGILDSVDLDSDNDGILDIYECPDLVVNTNFNATNGNTVSFAAPSADLGFIFDVFTLDNSFNLNINGVSLATSEIQFQQDQNDNIRFLDGARYGAGTVPQIYSMTGDANNPLVRIIIHKNGSVSMQGSKTAGGPLFPLQLFNGNNFNNITWNRSGSNTVVLSQNVAGTTYITGNGRGVKNGFCDPDNDGISNQYDVDSDGDGCPDAIEGSETVKYDHVHALNLPSTDPNYNFRGQIKVLANGTTPGTPNQIVSKIQTANGVPELVNNSINNTSGNAGVADNTDGTIDVGQAIGSSQNFAINACVCYNPAVTAGGAILNTSHGITSLNRAGADNGNWPMVRKGAWTALESKTKGFVPNRLTAQQIAAIPADNLVEGMMVYNTNSDCLQINTTGTAAGWKCFNTQTCTEVN